MALHREIRADIHQTIEDYMGSLSSQEAPVVGWCCRYVPIEVLESAGLIPLRLLPHPPAEMGDAYLNPNFCPYVRAIMGEGLGGAYPYLSGLVVINTCDGMRRLFDAWSNFHELPFAYLMDLPRITTPSAVSYFREEIGGLLDRVSSRFQVSVSPQSVVARVKASNHTHALLLKVEHLMRQGTLGLTGYEVAQLYRAGGILSRERFDCLLERILDQAGAVGKQNGIPILLTGSMLENPEIVSMIEACGGRVVDQDLCVRGRQSGSPIPAEDDPLMALARHYLLKPPCARMQENQRRIDHVVNLVRSCGVQGVIYYVLKFCDTFLYEIPALRETLNRMGIPMLVVESEYRKGQGGGIQTRIQAFLEMLDSGGSPGYEEVHS